MFQKSHQRWVAPVCAQGEGGEIKAVHFILLLGHFCKDFMLKEGVELNEFCDYTFNLYVFEVSPSSVFSHNFFIAFQ